MQNESSLLARIERLERDNRRWKRAGSLLLLGLVGLVSAGFGRDSSDGVLRGESLELSTPEGDVYGKVFLDGGGFPMFALQKDKARAIVTLNKPAVYVRNDDGLRGAFLGFDTRGLGKVELNGENLVDGVRMALKPDGSAGVYALDKEGYDRAALEYAAIGTATVSVRAPKGDVRGLMGTDAAGSSSMLLLDGNGLRRVGTVVQPDGMPLFQITDGKARPRLNATVDFDGRPRIEFLREDGAVGSRLP